MSLIVISQGELSSMGGLTGKMDIHKGNDTQRRHTKSWVVTGDQQCQTDEYGLDKKGCQMSGWPSGHQGNNVN